MIKFIINSIFVYPIKFLCYFIAAILYCLAIFIQLLDWAIQVGTFLVVFIYDILKQLFSFIGRKIKEKNYQENNIYKSTTNYTHPSFPKPPILTSKITPQLNIKDIYLTIYLSKYYAKKLMKDNSFDPEVLGVKDYDCPPIDIYDEEDYYKFEICEDSNYLGGQVTYLILKFTKGKARCTTGYNEQEIKYKYTYNPDNDKVLIDGYTEKELDKKINKIIKEFNELYDQVDRYMVLSDEDNAWDKVVKFFENYNTDFYIGNKIKELTDKNIIILELSFIEEYLKILRLAKKQFIFKEKRLVFENEYIIEEEPTEKVGFFESIFSNKKEEKELSWKEKEFEKEAKLWELSEEDKRIAKEERMSPADFIEAEERDDDELITDEWEDKL